jgi:putative ABC transport system ATP-binding protein
MDGVSAHNLFHRVGGLRSGVDVLRDVSLDAPAGAVTAVVGPAGAGKTSLLHVLAGLDRPASGSVTLAGRTLRGLDDIELTRLRRDQIGLLLPAASVLPTITVRENVALPLLIARRPPAPEAVDALLERVGLADAADELPSRLTGAERQRVALARALIGGPSLLLADEPAGDMEPEEGAELLLLLQQVAHEDGITVVLFTRDIDDAAGVADRIVMLDAGRVVPAPAAQLAA